MQGVRFGSLIPFLDLGIKKSRRYWLCKCDCGKKVEVKENALKTGNTKSCGCKKYRGKKKASRTNKEIREHLLSFKKGQTGCWLFTGYTLKGGYGSITWKRRPWIAHRLSWHIFHGDIPKGMLVCHSCDVPNCINPNHLFLGTYKDNSDDKVSKKRHRYGSTMPNVKVDEELVRFIRNNHKEHTIAELSRKLGLSEGCLRHIVKRRTWKHI